MELNEYQERAMVTCMESCNNWSYMFLNLVGEMGEFASKVAKAIRKDKMQIDGNDAIPNIDLDGTDLGDEWFDDLRKEAGDILWQLSGLCAVMDWRLEDVAQDNLDKLASRKERGVIDGSGDNR